MKPRLIACVDKAKECETFFIEYSRRVEAYNARVDNANALSKKVGTYWYVLPVPRLRSHARAAE
jgi:hypothetical protein